MRMGFVTVSAMAGATILFTLGVIDAATNKLVQKVAMKGASTPHSVAVNEANGHVIVPGGGGEGGCSCIQILAPQ